ncbi:MAG: two-component regulator propeller domain-containing protein [Proteiniphilum sp.]|uniref:hybrid sensor histidine kinase/response regulator transcription factor n=1 Tax=Proteiniphilum sp. TaxID=1926877 RepID=UPI002B210CFA|nr:two-component regulator propeller domain-containing protein [Proteiniphilum sp.]MEA5126854.1 two-component regulator propeller domain-containing protein [Proteiniphilum sp.]
MKKLLPGNSPSYLTLVYAAFVLLFVRIDCMHSQQNPDGLDFNILSTSDGFPTNEIQKVFQDREGFIWFATRNGLCKYDGYQITVYNSNQLKLPALTNNNIHSLADDNQGNLWVGTYSGINRFNKRAGKFEPVEIRNTTNKVVSCILVTKNNEVWIGLDDGLFSYDPRENAFTHHSLRKIGDRAITASIKSIVEDSSGEIWIGTWNNGLYRYSPSKNIFYAYPQLNPRNSAHVIYEDSRKNIWIGTWGEGLHLLENPRDMDNLRLKTYWHDANDPESLSDNLVYDICEDLHTNTLWIGTRSGLSLLENDNPSGFMNWSTTHNINKLPSNEINSIIRDNKGNIWIGTIGGGVLFTNTEKSKFDYFGVDLPEIPTGAIRSVFWDNEDNMWMGVGTYGVVLYDKEQEKIVSQQNLSEFGSVPQTTIYDIKQRNAGEILFGTYGGGLWVYKKGKPVKSYTENNCAFISDNRIRSIYIDRQRNTWIGTQYGLGVWLNDNTGFTFDDIIVDGRRLEPSSMIDITEDDAGRIWIATINNGIISVEGDPADKEELTFRSYTAQNGKISAHTIHVLYRDTSGRLWAGSEGGRLYLYDEASGSFIDKSPQFSILGTLISSIREDRQGNLWVGTSNGLARLSFNETAELTSYRVYTTADGLCDNFFIPRSSCDYKGELFFGGYKGLVRFNPDNIEIETNPTPFYITDIRVLNTSFYNLNEEITGKISEKVPSFSDRITIPHKYNNFSIHFATLNYKNPELNRYAYRLAGFNQEWTYADSKQNVAYYNNLSPGQYVFQLKATTQNGVWNDEIKEMRINVLPPFWLSWWAFIIYFCLLTLIAYAIYRNILNRIHMRNQLRYKEIEQEKAEELNHAKLQFFTNITHEFLTPLTIISATMDELQLTSPRNDDLYATMGRNVNRLTRLLQQILEFRKAETGNLQLRVANGSISEFIKNAIESFYPLIRKKKLHFSYVSDPEDIQGLLDIDKLDKILYNLVSNAAKYVTEDGYIQVTLSYRDEAKDYICISVKDNGAGISKEDQQTLFKRFYEGNHRRYNTTGTGIGLSLVKDLVNLYHGTIEVESEIGKGSEFAIILPIDASCFGDAEIDTEKVEPVREMTVMETPAIKEEEEAHTEKKQKTSSVLVVEDNAEILQLVHRLLNRDYHVLTATNGKEAMLILEHEKADIIVSDIMMPEMDGVELCKSLKNNIEYSHIPIILLTAKTDEKDRADAYESGADAFISKPFNLNVLHARIKNLLKSRERIARDFKNQLVFELKDLEFTNLDEEFIQKAVDCVNRHLDHSDFDQQQFSEEMNVSKSTLYNKLKTLTGLNTSAFITNIRLKAACRIMDQNRNIRISDLAYAVGFNDPKYFSSCFKKEFNMRPSEYIERFTGTLGE